MTHKLVDHIVATFAHGVIPESLYADSNNFDIYELIWITWHFDWHVAAIMYASLHPPWGRGKFERKSNDTYLANHKIKDD